MRTKLKLKKKVPFLSQSEQLTIDQTFEEVQNNKWSQAQLSSSYIPDKIPCRNQQKHIISHFIYDSLAKRTNSRLLYIFGVPGVGKTVLTMQIIHKLQKQIDCKKVSFNYINALQLKRANNIYFTMLQIIRPQLLKKISKNQTNLIQNLHQQLLNCKQMKIFVIDEVDYLMTKDQSIFYNLSEWTSLPSTKISLIIIANTMNFAQKLHSKIVSRMGNHIIVFKPYSHSEIKSIVMQRLQGGQKYFSESAVNFACKKMSTFTSDIRLILTVLQKSYKAKNNNLVTIDTISKVWKEQIKTKPNQDNHNEQQTLQNKIVDILNLKSGKCTSRQLYDSIQNRNNYIDFICALRNMSEMDQIKMSEQSLLGFVDYSICLNTEL